MGRQLIDITGKKYNMLTVLKFSHMVKNRSFWVCQCDSSKRRFPAGERSHADQKGRSRAAGAAP